MFEYSGWLTTLLFAADWLIRLGLAVRVIMRRLPVGVALAWLSVVLIFPLAGALVYLFLGEYRLGHRRRQRIAAAQEQWLRLLHDALPQSGALPQPGAATKPGASPVEHKARPSQIARLGQSALLAPPLPGNHLELLAGADAAFPAMIAEIDRAQTSCDLEFYIWFPGGRADEVEAALIRAAARGVRCRVLVDALGSKSFLKRGRAAQLRRQGVQVQAALQSSLLTLSFVRPDLRMHRKIMVIDRQVGFTGSMNLADPHYFKQEAGVGQWVDALVCVRGPAVHALAASFLASWSVETGVVAEEAEWFEDALTLTPVGPASVQVLGSGPALRVEGIEQVVLMAVYSARRELTLTTPYFVPSESLHTALLSAAASGVAVTLILPARVDSRLVQYASRAYQSDLVAAGVRVALYEGGLLHTKSITVDDELSLFGSLNLDPRSLRLNFEITLAIEDAEFTGVLKQLQKTYLDQSRTLDPDACRQQPALLRLTENTARLLGPVL